MPKSGRVTVTPHVPSAAVVQLSGPVNVAPGAANVTSAPAIGAPALSMSVTVTGAGLEPAFAC